MCGWPSASPHRLSPRVHRHTRNRCLCTGLQNGLLGAPLAPARRPRRVPRTTILRSDSLLLWRPQGDVYQDGVFSQLCAEFPELALCAPRTFEEAAKELKDATCAWGRLSPELLAAADNCPRLRWLHNPRSAPPTGYYFQELVAHPVAVTNARGMYNDQLPVHVMTLLLTLNRHMHHYRDQQLQQIYRPLGSSVPNISLTGATVLLVGVGESGVETARLCSTALGMRVIGVDARASLPYPNTHHLCSTYWSSLRRLLCAASRPHRPVA
jgi:phosphoglycerate dehydrogenase-like enzyme